MVRLYFSNFVQCFHPLLQILPLVLLWSLSVKSEGLVNGELATQAVDGSNDGSGQDDTEWYQLRGNLLERAQALGDRVGWMFLLVLGGSGSFEGAQVPRCSSA